MSVTFFQAKNGTRTCSANGINLHSAYNPEKEAERFVETLQCTFNPVCVIITGPALSWVIGPLRNRFRRARLCAIRYSHDFSDSDIQWDSVFDGTGPQENLEDQLFNVLGGEDGIYASLFAAWKPSTTAYPKQQALVWDSIRNVVLKSRSILATRTLFAARWLKNSCLFCKNVLKTAYVLRGSSSIVIAASGPSLRTSLPFMKKNRKQFFLIAVSSAIEPLLFYGIRPDLCITTDGGYYAKKHLDILLRTGIDIPLAMSAEAASNPYLTRTHTIIPLTYGDSPEKEFLSCCGIQAMPAERNGTVSGTAVKFALSITTGHVFCCGLDLAPGRGYQHTQPNALENGNSRDDNRIRPLMTRLVSESLSTASLKIYRDWFIAHAPALSSRVFRLSDHFAFAYRLGVITDVNWSFFQSVSSSEAPHIIKTVTKHSPDDRIHRIHDMIHRESLKESWLHNAFPAEYLLWKRSNSPEASQTTKNILTLKNISLQKQLQKAIDG